MSWAVSRTCPSGGRRRIHSRRPSVTTNVRLEQPPDGSRAWRAGREWAGNHEAISLYGTGTRLRLGEGRGAEAASSSDSGQGGSVVGGEFSVSRSNERVHRTGAQLGPVAASSQLARQDHHMQTWPAVQARRRRRPPSRQRVKPPDWSDPGTLYDVDHAEAEYGERWTCTAAPEPRDPDDPEHLADGTRLQVQRHHGDHQVANGPRSIRPPPKTQSAIFGGQPRSPRGDVGRRTGGERRWSRRLMSANPIRLGSRAHSDARPANATRNPMATEAIPPMAVMRDSVSGRSRRDRAGHTEADGRFHNADSARRTSRPASTVTVPALPSAKVSLLISPPSRRSRLSAVTVTLPA